MTVTLGLPLGAPGKAWLKKTTWDETSVRMYIERVRREERSNKGCRIDGTQYVHLKSSLLVIETFVDVLVDRVFYAADKMSRY